MKRPPGLWILLSAGVLWLSLQDVYGIRATALIFGKSSTSTTTETPSSASPESNNEETATNPEQSTTTSNSTTNSTQPVLTGIPQLDYIWDPNLPKELNGYNLSEYPFYERVPAEEIEFKCDGLHDGFYASVPHKCQVYHHCLFGTRYDFLCANYTAFDQKTFICHFVSEVDCVNSKKFWHRNDALYQAATTTTQAPLRSHIYTTAPPDGADPITPLQDAPRRPLGGGSRRPYRPNRRRRPQFDYYDEEYYDDDYYEDRPRANRGRKRPSRPRRPVYDDDDEEYEDERSESRRGSSRRRPYKKRNKDRRKPDYEEDEEEVEDRFEDEDFVAAHKRTKTEERRNKRPTEDEDDESSERDRKRPSDKRRSPSNDDDRKPVRKSTNRRPANDDYEDELPLSDDSQTYEDRPRKKHKSNNVESGTSQDGRPIIKPTTGTIYDRPRVAPRINLPVPKNAADKFAYKGIGGHTTSTTTTAPSPTEEEYEDEEYEETLPKKSAKRRPTNEPKTQKEANREASRHRSKRPDTQEAKEKTTTTRTKSKYSPPARNRYRTTSSSKPKPASEEYDDVEEDEEYLEEKEVHERRPIAKTSSTTTTELPKKEPVMRIIKRPFLPSRGGSPYSPRGLQPIGLKAVDNKSSEETQASKETDQEYEDEDKSGREPQEEPQRVRKPAFKPSPVIVKVPVRQKYVPPSGEAQELIDSEPSRQQTYKTRDHSARTTPKPKLEEKNPLDLDEYDVTLNDALNPTLPNLPVRAFPTGFSSGDYNSYSTITRPRYVLEPIVSPSNQNYIYPNKVVRSQNRHEATVQHGQFNTGYRQPHRQTQAIYSSY